MGTRWSDCRLFFTEFRRNFRTTGAVLPSGRRLARALSRFVRDRADGQSRRILEVGPGTGAVTQQIVADLGTNDRLDLVELNDSFVECLRNRFETDAAFQRVADRSRVLHCSVEQLPAEPTYDVIVSGLPLNNFAVVEVENILRGLVGLLHPAGTLSFFEYMALRRLKGLVSCGAERARLRGIGRIMGKLLTDHEIHRDWIWPNVPPAWVHHVRPGK